MIADILTHTPPKVWVILAILLLIGYKSCFKRKQRILRLLITPVIFLYMEYSTIVNLFSISYMAIVYSIIGLSIGITFGIRMTINKEILVDKKRYMVLLPAEPILLVLIVLNFSFQYMLHVLASIEPDIIAKLIPEFSIAMAVFSGIMTGRSGNYLYKFIRLPHHDIK